MTSVPHDQPVPSQAVRFSLVAAVYNVERYLPDFIASIENQTFPLGRVQIVVVDDGSTDASLTALKEWSDRHPGLVTVVTKENGGQGSARNLGLDYATGEWITFPDPDDFVDPDYLERVDAFLLKQPTSAMVATNRLMFEEATGQVRDAHPLRRLFDVGDRTVDIEAFSEFFHGAVNSAFYRGDRLRREGLRFDLRVRPNFEDGHFSCRYLLDADRPVIGFVRSARYLYRVRADRSSTVQTSLLDADRFVAVPRFGYLQLLQHAIRAKGAAPEWLQNCILYELSFYFSADARISDVASAAHGEVAQRFVEALREIAALLSPSVIESFGLRRFDSAWQEILLHGLAGGPWHTPYVVVRRTDEVRDRIQIAYRFAGERPQERILHKGREFVPGDAKVRTHEYWNHSLLYERLVWVPARGTLRVLLDGRPVEFRADWPQRRLTTMRPAQRARLLDPPSPVPVRLTVRDRTVRRLARTLPLRWRYRRAWVLLDRLHNADDNAERLFRYVRDERSDINAWFVLEKGTPDWRRLRADGYRRVVPHGSLRWKLLMLNCRHLVSSHADAEVHSPPAILKYGPPQWRFSFLQHGVIRDDISRWLNRKRMDLFVTSTPMEHESIVGDGTPYDFTTFEVKRTGMPRFDRLRALGNEIPPERRTRLLVSPTWRQWLSEPKQTGTHRRDVTDGFLASQFTREWLAFLCSDRLRALAEREKLTIDFLLHPILQPGLPALDLPAHIRPLTFEGQDVQRMFAEAAVLVTDYSSIAFNAAYIERPVVYFQFDAALVLGGGHTGRYGYFEYERDSFGMVAETADEAVAAVEETVRAGRVPAPEYLRRIRETFPDRDGRCCERTVAAVAALDEPVT